jgi:hypothetical protein
MGISSMAQSINTLTGLMQTLVNASKDSLTQSDNNNNNVQQGSKTVQPSVTVTKQIFTRGNKSLNETYCRIKGVIPLSWRWTTTYCTRERNMIIIKII